MHPHITFAVLAVLSIFTNSAYGANADSIKKARRLKNFQYREAVRKQPVVAGKYCYYVLLNDSLEKIRRQKQKEHRQKQEEHRQKQEKTIEYEHHRPIAHRYGIWYTPTGARATVINGVALGFLATGDNLKINGINIEADPIAILYGFFPSVLQGIETQVKDIQRSPTDTAPITVITNGLSITTIAWEDRRSNGLNINLTGSNITEMNGVEISGINNHHRSFRGLTIALANVSQQGRGVQLGLFNYCKEGQVLQIGLINKLGGRILPVTNFRSEKEVR